jgi:hypothetical protein
VRPVRLIHRNGAAGVSEVLFGEWWLPLRSMSQKQSSSSPEGTPARQTDQKSRNMPSPRFLGAAALASVIAGVLVSHKWGHTAGSRLVRVTPASPEMMQLLRGSSNQHQITQVLDVVQRTLGFRIARGLLERPVYREFFAAGLTVFDPVEGSRVRRGPATPSYSRVLKFLI